MQDDGELCQKGAICSRKFDRKRGFDREIVGKTKFFDSHYAVPHSAELRGGYGEMIWEDGEVPALRFGLHRM